jgi:hypothetical protein
MQRLTLAALCGVFALLLQQNIALGQSGTDCFISMRSTTGESSLNFVALAQRQNDQQTTGIQAFDGNTYYLSDSDGAAVQAALADQDTVQLHAAPAETTSDETTPVVCLVQASQ